jgi:thioredoxin reductase (NADPH)
MAAMTPAILLTVDDDPEVSRALARDLRQRYGEDYRIRRAESGRRPLMPSKSSNSGTRE